MPHNIRLVRRGDRRRVPWKNGAGFTDEIAVDAAQDWRISIADLGDRPSMFSALDHFDRVFTVIGVHAVTLTWDDEDRSVHPFEPCPFDGSSAPRCTPQGSTSAFNVMVNKTSGTATVTARHTDGRPIDTDPRDITVVYVGSGSISADNLQAHEGECIVVEREGVELTGSGHILLAQISVSET